MNYIRYHILLSSFFVVIGIVFCCFYNRWIIITTASFSSPPLYAQNVTKKNITYYYFYNDKWNTETQDILWEHNTTTNIHNLINNWLRILYEEKIIPKQTSLQSVLLSNSATAYLSFDHNIFSKQDSIFKKWMLIEGILKTISAQEIPIHSIQFLVQHKHMHDPHLDFSRPWPIQGFLH